MRVSRRSFLKGFSVAMAAGLLGTGYAWNRFGRPQAADLTNWRGFSPDDIALLNDIADVIIPATDTPGAREAEVGDFIAIAVTECYEPPMQSAFVYGLEALERRCQSDYGASFRTLAAADRVAVLSAIDGERKYRELWLRGERGVRLVVRPLTGVLPPPVQVPHFFTMMKELTVLGYFTSWPGATKALRHKLVPGAYDGALPYKKGDRAWAMS